MVSRNEQLANSEGLARRLRNYVRVEDFLGVADFPVVHTSLAVRKKKSKRNRLYANKVNMGAFFEVLAQAMFGGKHYHYNYFADDHLRPDVVDLSPPNPLVVESKACVASGNLPLRDVQFHGLRLAQERLAFDNQFEELGDVRLAIFRHTFANIGWFGDGPNKLHLSERSFYRRLGKGPLAALDMDLLVADILHDPEFGSDLMYRYPQNGERNILNLSNKPFEYCSSIYGTTLFRFIVEPEAVLEQLGFSSDEYIVQQRLSPEGLRIGGAPVRPFPITSVSVADRQTQFSSRVARWQEMRDEYVTQMRLEAHNLATYACTHMNDFSSELYEKHRQEALNRWLPNWDGILSSPEQK